MKRLFLIGILSIFGGHAYAASFYQLEMRMAQVYAEAQMYDKAISSYKDLLDKGLNSWQRSVVEYDIGNLYAMQEAWDKAVKQYSSIGIAKDSSPLLALRVNTNLGIAHYQIALGLSHEEEKPDNNVKILYHLNLSKLAFEQAGNAECEIQKLGDIEPCLISKMLEEWQLKTNAALKEVKDKLTTSGTMPQPVEEKVQPSSPEGMLTYLIDLQEKVLFENSLNQKSDKEGQKKVLDLANQFIPLVLKEQSEKYESEGTCQSSPWGEALPLFDDGRQSAVLAYEEDSLLQAITFQEDTIHQWKSALEAIKNPKNPKGSCFAGRTQGKSQENQQTTAEQPASTEEVLRLLQEMYMEDNIKPSGVPAIKMVDKPW